MFNGLVDHLKYSSTGKYYLDPFDLSFYLSEMPKIIQVFLFYLY